MTTAPEFSRPIAIEGIIPDKTRHETIAATEEECVALARRFDVRGLSDFKAKLSVRRVSGGTAVHVEGRFEADVVQACVISLRDVPSHIEGAFDTYFTEDKVDESDVDISHDTLPHAENSPEMIANGHIDLGEVVAQYLALELEPYPRAPGVSLAAQMAESGSEVKNRPFGVLEGLKSAKKKDKGDK